MQTKKTNRITRKFHPAFELKPTKRDEVIPLTFENPLLDVEFSTKDHWEDLQDLVIR